MPTFLALSFHYADNIVLTVTDKDGGVTNKTTTAVKVDNVAPNCCHVMAKWIK
jgi:hypothetical protein